MTDLTVIGGDLTALGGGEGLGGDLTRILMGPVILMGIEGDLMEEEEAEVVGMVQEDLGETPGVEGGTGESKFL